MEIITEQDATLDILAIVEDSPPGRLIGEEQIIDNLTLDGNDKTAFVITLSNGQKFRVFVREIAI